MFSLLRRFFNKGLSPANAYNENNGAGIHLSFIPEKDTLVFIKSAGTIAVALVLPVKPTGLITDGFIYRLESGWEEYNYKGVLDGIKACHLVYDDAVTFIGSCPVVKKEPRHIVLKGNTLHIDQLTLDLEHVFSDYNKLKQVFWSLSIPFMGPSTLLAPLQEQYVRTLYDIAITGRKLPAHDADVVKFLERYNYIQQQSGGDYTITQRAGKVFKTAMAASDMRTATLRLARCIECDVWPYYF